MLKQVVSKVVQNMNIDSRLLLVTQFMVRKLVREVLLVTENRGGDFRERFVGPIQEFIKNVDGRAEARD